MSRELKAKLCPNRIRVSEGVFRCWLTGNEGKATKIGCEPLRRLDECSERSMADGYAYRDMLQRPVSK